jgi:hypothetical protein
MHQAAEAIYLARLKGSRTQYTPKQFVERAFIKAEWIDRPGGHSHDDSRDYSPDRGADRGGNNGGHRGDRDRSERGREGSRDRELRGFGSSSPVRNDTTRPVSFFCYF